MPDQLVKNKTRKKRESVIVIRFQQVYFTFQGKKRLTMVEVDVGVTV